VHREFLWLFGVKLSVMNKFIDPKHEVFTRQYCQITIPNWTNDGFPHIASNERGTALVTKGSFRTSEAAQHLRRETPRHPSLTALSCRPRPPQDAALRPVIVDIRRNCKVS
jgi:hypothetical protein